MKVRVGYGIGSALAPDPRRFGELCTELERLGFDSLWLSERATAEGPDPLIGLAYAAGCTRKLKLGMSVLVVPGRNPALLAKELASLDRLSDGRLLPGFGLGIADPREQQAFGVRREERAAWFDEAVPLIRRIWTEETVDHDGPRFSYRGLRVRPFPAQSPPDVWLGGDAPSELRRVGRLGDGWLPSFCTPETAAKGRLVIEEAAEEAGRRIDPEHFGALVGYRYGELPERVVQALAVRRPELDAADVLPRGLAALQRRLEEFVDAGFSKFVVLPIDEPPSWREELESVAAEVLPLQASRRV